MSPSPGSPALYLSWTGIAQAMKQVATTAVETGHATDTSSQIVLARFDRFLSRVFADGDRSEWLLKGGVSMLARVARSRSTKDVDLAVTTITDPDEAITDLARLAARDLGDHLRFQLVNTRSTGFGDHQPGVQTRRALFGYYDAAANHKIGEVPIDVRRRTTTDWTRRDRHPRQSTRAPPATDQLPLPALPGRRSHRRQGVRHRHHLRRGTEQPGQGPGRPRCHRPHPPNTSTCASCSSRSMPSGPCPRSRRSTASPSPTAGTCGTASSPPPRPRQQTSPAADAVHLVDAMVTPALAREPATPTMTWVPDHGWTTGDRAR